MAFEKTKASALTGAGVFTIMFLLMIFNQAGDNSVAYCNSTEEICIARDGFSGGEHTRCYNETDANWWDVPYCEEGWTIIQNDLPEQNDSEENQNNTIPKETNVTAQKVKCNTQGCKQVD